MAGKTGVTIEGSKKVISMLASLKGELPASITTVLQNLSRLTTDQMQKTAPVDTGNLRHNISYEVSGTTATISSNAEYSGFVNYGTKYMNAQSFFSDGVEFAKQRLVKMMADEIKKDIQS